MSSVAPAATAPVPAAPPAAPAQKTERQLLEEILEKSGASASAGTAKLSFETVAGFEALQRGAKLLAASTIVPEVYRGNLPNCVIALNMATRMRADVLLVMQNLYVVHGRPAWSAQFVIAAFNSSGRFSPLRYRFTGEKGKDSWGCVAWARELATGELIEGTEITLAMAKAEGWFGKNGSKWQTMPEQMLRYRSGAFLVKTVAPELLAGLSTVDEVEDGAALQLLDESADVAQDPPAATGNGSKAADLAAKLKARVAPAPAPEKPAEREPGDDTDELGLT